MKVIFKGGPADGRTASKPTLDHIAVDAGTDGGSIRQATYDYDGDGAYVFGEFRRVRRLVGGPGDGRDLSADTPLKEGDHIIVPCDTDGKQYAWYKPAGDGRWSFDGYVAGDDMEVIEKAGGSDE